MPLPEEDLVIPATWKAPVLHPIQPGDRFGHLVAVCSSSIDPRRWIFRCDCGAQHELAIRYVLHRHKRDQPLHCGCQRRSKPQRQEPSGDYALTTHVPRRRKRRKTTVRHPLVQYWYRLQDELRNPNHPMYPEARFYGIKLCARWLNDVQAFIEDVSPGYQPGSTQRLVRVLRHQDYAPGNVAWMSPSEANSHQNRCFKVDTPDGTMPINRAAALYGVNPFAIRRAVERGEPLEDLIGTTPKRRQPKPRGPKVLVPTPEGEFLTLTEAAKRSGVGRVTIYERMKRGWPVDRLLEPSAKR